MDYILKRPITRSTSGDLVQFFYCPNNKVGPVFDLGGIELFQCYYPAKFISKPFFPKQMQRTRLS